MKTLLLISPLALLVTLAWMPVEKPVHKQTRIERQRAVMELYERVRPDFSRKEVEELPMPLTGDVTGECDL